MFRFTNLIIFQLTRDCNLRCKYCLMLEKDNYKNELIDFSLYKQIINRITKQHLINRDKNDTLSFNFHGGEALLVGPEQFYKYVEYAHRTFQDNKLNFTIGLQTNGTLLNEEYAFILNKFNMSVGISLDDLGKGNDVRLKNSESLYIKRIKMLNKYNVKYGFLPAIHKSNVNRFEKFVNKVNTFTGEFEYSTNLIISPDNKKETLSLEVSGKEYFKKIYMPNIKKEINSVEGTNHQAIKKGVNKILYDILTVHKDNWISGCWGKYCGAGITMIAVHPDGEMGYCDRYTKKFEKAYIQHALDYDFLGIYQLKKTIEFNYEKSFVIKENGCDTCKAEFTCNNECLSMYYSKHGKYGIDKSKVCEVSLSSYNYVEKNIVNIAKKYRDVNKPVVYASIHEFIEFRKDTINMLNKHNIRVEIDKNRNEIYFR